MCTGRRDVGYTGSRVYMDVCMCSWAVELQDVGHVRIEYAYLRMGVLFSINPGYIWCNTGRFV